MSMIYTVIGRNAKKDVLLVIAAFSEQQVPIAVRNLRKAHPDAAITIDSHLDESRFIDEAKRY